MKVRIPSLLVNYTGRSEVEARGNTLGEVLRDLDARHPGLRFRIVDEQDQVRPHVRIFINRQQAQDLAASVEPRDEVAIVGALSGG